MHALPPDLAPLLQAAARTRRRFALTVFAALLAGAALGGLWRDAEAGRPAPLAETGRTFAPRSAAEATPLRMEAAMHLLREGHLAEAYGRLARLADEGHGGAALMALALVRHGAALNGNPWSATTGQLRRWSDLALQDLRDHTAAISLHERGE